MRSTTRTWFLHSKSAHSGIPARPIHENFTGKVASEIGRRIKKNT
jgi:hypothetical protein